MARGSADNLQRSPGLLPVVSQDLGAPATDRRARRPICGRRPVGVRSCAVTGRRAARDPSVSWRLSVDFQLARRRIEALDHYPTITRARALAAYVGAFDFADEQGIVEVPSEQIAAEFEIGRASWLHYRTVLEEAGLVEVDEGRGGIRRGFRLLPPAEDQPGIGKRH